MTEAIVKEGFDLAEKEVREKQVQEVKRIVTKTLEKLDEVKKEIRELQEEERILKMDIDDLKEGKIDRIVERQEKDPKAKQVSVVVILKEKEIIREVSPWYWPYRVVWPTYPAPVIEPLPVWNGNTIVATCENTSGEKYTMTSCGSGESFIGYANTINCSVAKDAVVGTYDVNGHPVHLR